MAVVTGITLANAVTQDVLELDKITTDSYVLQSVEWSPLQGKHHSYKYVNQVGETLVNTTLEARDVEIIGWVVAGGSDEMTRLKRALNSFFNPQQPVVMMYGDYNMTFRPDTTVSYSDDVLENNDVVCKFKVTGYAADPLWRANERTTSESAATVDHFRFPLVMPDPADPPDRNVFGVRRSSYFIHVSNDGDLPTGIEVTFFCDSHTS